MPWGMVTYDRGAGLSLVEDGSFVGTLGMELPLLPAPAAE